MRKRNQKGMSLAEVMVALAICTIMIFATLTVTTTAYQSTRNNRDKEFATQKAISMLNELKVLIQAQNGNNVNVLDAYDDGITNRPSLTTIASITDPAAPISGNTPLTATQWLFERRVTVQLLPGQPANVRLVNVKVFKNDGLAGKRLLAEVASVLRTIAAPMPPTQVYDVYAIAIENVPGWWVYMSNIVPFVQQAVNNLQARNPGLAFRVHWINTISYGRDKEYRPYINNTDASGNPVDTIQPIHNGYFYPGRMPDPTGTFAPIGPLDTDIVIGNNFYYYPDFFRGHMNVDNVDTNGFDATRNPQPYAIADQFNAGMRYPDELALYNERKAANPAEEMTFRLLLDDMNMHPSKYTNAIMLNLHGELLPFPHIRNYSDAAKDPGCDGIVVSLGCPSVDMRDIRVVTHPEQLTYTNGNTEDIKLRVYSYLTDPGKNSNFDWIGKGNLGGAIPITITLKGLSTWNPAAADIQRITGGTDQDATAGVDAYGLSNAPNGPGTAPNQMYYTTSTNGTDRIIKLYNSPLKTPCDNDTCSGAGLDPNARLYGMEYIPAPMENFASGNPTQFSTNLTTGGDIPKNTARWIIRIPAANLLADRMWTIETRIGDDVTTGTIQSKDVLSTPNVNIARNKPTDLSTTYVWRGTDNWIYGTAANDPNMPLTERFQLMGDPRHCPYADLKRTHNGSGAGTTPNPDTGGLSGIPGGMGYNRFFDDFESAGRAKFIGRKVGPFNITVNSNDRVRFTINGVNMASSVQLGAGLTRTAAQVANDLNSAAAFNALATADVVGGRVRVLAKIAAQTSTVQFVTGTANNASATLGFDGNSYGHTSFPWNGWAYTAGSPVQSYGIKNDGTTNNEQWDGGLELDMPRIFQIVRRALTRTQTVYTTMTGFSYYYIGIGNEIGYDSANHFKNSIPVNTRPYTGLDGAMNENTILSSVRYIRENVGSNYWWGQPWLGELYPDRLYNTQWAPDASGNARGNLPTAPNTGATADTFIRDARENIVDPNQFDTPNGTQTDGSVRVLSAQGSTTFFWIGSAASTFHHRYADGTNGALQAAGTEIANNYNFPLPDPIPNARPFSLTVNDTSMNPDFFLQNVYGGALTAGVQSQFYQNTSSSIEGSSLVWLRDGATNPTFVVVNGLSPTGISGAALIARWSFLSLTQAYLTGGLYAGSNRIREVPQVMITDPNPFTNLNNPSTVTINWTKAWKRWDGQNYTSGYSNSFSEETGTNPLTVKFAVLYSPSNGVPDPANGSPTGWKYITDNSSATLGVKPDAAHETTALTYNWSTPAASFPQGNYLLRVEAYREGQPMHYAYHQYRAFLRRPS